MSSKRQLQKLLPTRTKSSNKTSGGKVLIIGGGKGLYGAGILAGLASTRTGAGYTHLMTDLIKFPWLKFPDFILHPLTLKELKNKQDFAIGIGPGLGINKKNKRLIDYLIKHHYEKVVVDADSLTVIANHNLFPLPPSWVLTPHEGELARLLNVKPSEIKKNRLQSIKDAAKKFRCTILLKGADTLISAEDLSRVLKVSTGTPALSKAGTGDVLLGMVVAFRAQGLNPSDACFLAASLHGIVASEWENEGNDQLSLRPTDLIERLPKTIRNLRDD